MLPFLGKPAGQGGVVTPPPPSGSKPQTSPILEAKGCSFVWQDRILEAGGPTDDRDIFQGTTGARVSEDPVVSGSYSFPNENNRRLSFTTFDGKPCLKSTFLAGAHGWLNYRGQVLPGRYVKGGLCVDVFVPSDFEVLNSSGGTIFGKSLFGLLLGHPKHMKVGVPLGWDGTENSRAGRGVYCVPEDQLGAEMGLSWTSRNTTKAFELDLYCHVPGRMSGGTYYPRMDTFSNMHNISGVSTPPKVAVPKGQWFTLTFYVQIDTNAADGAIELWINANKVASVYNIDLGGWVGDRNLYRGRTKPAAADGAADSDYNRQNYSFGYGDLSNTDRAQNAQKGGWRLQGIMIREMIGGATYLATNVPVKTSSYYAHNWRFYGAL